MYTSRPILVLLVGKSMLVHESHILSCNGDPVIVVYILENSVRNFHNLILLLSL